MDEAEFYSRDERGYVSMLGLMRQEAAEKQDEFARGMEFACWMSCMGREPVAVGRVMRQFAISRGTAYRWLSRWRAETGAATESGMARGIRFARWALAQDVLDSRRIAVEWGITTAMAQAWMRDLDLLRSRA